MCEQTEVNYLDGDIVWVKLGPCWWPGQVQDLSKVPTDIAQAFKKQPLAVVKFFQEDKYEYVKNLNNIYKYNCRKKNEFIKKGLDMYRNVKNSFMEKFPADVCKAETLTGGDPNIITSDEFAPEQKPNYAELFGTPSPKKSPKFLTTKGRPSTSGQKTATKMGNKRIIHPRFVGKSDYEVTILEQVAKTPPAKVPSYIKCSYCDFQSTRLNCIVLHTKSHSADFFKDVRPKSKPRSPKKGKKQKASFSHTTTFDEDLELIRKGVVINTSESSDNEEENEKNKGAPKRKTPKTKSTSHKKQKINASTTICNNLLADWSENESDEPTESSQNDSQISQENSQKQSDDSAMQIDKEPEVSKSSADQEVSEKETQIKDTVKTVPKEKPKADSNENGKVSCFDFEEEEEQTVLEKSPGRKIPRVIPQKRKSSDISDTETRDFSKKREPRSISRSSARKESTSKEAEKDKELQELDDAFKNILDETEVPDLPTIDNLKPNQNFQERKPIKSPDKKSDDSEKTNGVLKLGATQSETVQKEPTKEKDFHIGPKKRFVRNFEDFEMFHNEQQKADESAKQGSSLEVSKLKSQLMSKLTTELPQNQEKPSKSSKSLDDTPPVLEKEDEAPILEAEQEKFVTDAVKNDSVPEMAEEPPILSQENMDVTTEETIEDTPQHITPEKPVSEPMETAEIFQELQQNEIENFHEVAPALHETQEEKEILSEPVLQVLEPEKVEIQTFQETEKIQQESISEHPEKQKIVMDISYDNTDHLSGLNALAAASELTGNFDFEHKETEIRQEEKQPEKTIRPFEETCVYDQPIIEEIQEAEQPIIEEPPEKPIVVEPVMEDQTIIEEQTSIDDLQVGEQSYTEEPIIEEPVEVQPIPEEQTIIEEQSIVEEQTVIEQPLMEEQIQIQAQPDLETETVEEQLIEEQTVVEQPVMENQTLIEEHPLVEEQIVVEKEPVLEEHPLEEHAEQTVDDQALTEEQTIVEQPVMEEQTIIEQQVMEEQVIVEEPAIIEETVIDEALKPEDIPLPVSPKKVRTLANFSMDFSDSNESFPMKKEEIQETKVSHIKTTHVDTNIKRLGNVTEIVTDTTVDVNFTETVKDASDIPTVSEYQPFTFLEEGNVAHEEYIEKMETIETTETTLESEMAKLTDTHPGTEEVMHEQSHNTSSSKLLEILTEPKTGSTSRKYIGIPKSVISSSNSKLNMVISGEKGGLMRKFDSKTSKLIIKSTTSGPKTPLSKTSKPFQILSEKIIKPVAESETVSVKKISVASKRTYQDIEDIDTFVIQKSKKSHTGDNEMQDIILTPKSEATRQLKSTSRTRGKAKIIEQTIIKAADVPATQETGPLLDDSMFDINSMPIVLSDQILTPESIENMPVVMSDLVVPISVASPTQTVEKPQIAPLKRGGTLHQVKLLNKTPKVATSQAQELSPKVAQTIVKTLPRGLAKNQKVYQTSSTKLLKNNPAVITQPGKPGKFIILPTSSAGTSTGSKYTVGKRLAIKTTQSAASPTTSKVKAIPGLHTEPTGNKIMIVTNNQGVQSRVLLTPSQQKLLAGKLPGSKITKTQSPQLKANVHSKSILTSKGTLLTSVNSGLVTSQKTPSLVTQTIMTSKGQIFTSTQGQALVTSEGQVLTPLTPQQLRSIKSDTKGRKASPGSRLILPDKQVETPKGKLMMGGKAKTILIKGPQGQTIKKFTSGTPESKHVYLPATSKQYVATQNLQHSGLLGKQVVVNSKGQVIKGDKAQIAKQMAEKVNIQRMSKTPRGTTKTKQMLLSPATSTTTKQTSTISVPPLAPIVSQVKKNENLIQEQPQIKLPTIIKETKEKVEGTPLEQKHLIIQDAMGNQTTVTEGQILALPSEAVDGQPQSYMLVTVDESGNLAPISNETLMSLDPNLALGGDMSNIVLQFDQQQAAQVETPAETKSETITSEIPTEQTITETIPAGQQIVSIDGQQIVLDQSQQIVGEQQIVLNEGQQMLSNQETTYVDESGQQIVAPEHTDTQTVACNITSGETSQQLIITGDPESTQKFLASLSEGNTDLSSLLSGAEGNIIINTDGQQILLNTDAENQILLMPTSTEEDMSQSAMYVTQQQMKNQDILAAALADTDVFQQDATSDKLSVSQELAQIKVSNPPSQLSPNSALYPMNVGNVLETSLTLGSPIMTPLEVPSAGNKKIKHDLESTLMTQVPSSLELPITITDPNIAQSVSQQVMLGNDLQANLDLPISISDTITSIRSTEMSSPNFVYSLPSLEETTDIGQKTSFAENSPSSIMTSENIYSTSLTGSMSMPLLTEEPEVPPVTQEEVTTESVIEPMAETTLELQPEIPELQSEFREHPSEFTEHPSEFIEHPSEFSEHPSEFTEHSSEFTGHQTEVKEFHSEVTKPESAVTEIQSEGTEVQLAVTELQPEVSELQPEVTELQPEVTELQPEVTELKPEVTELQAEVTELQPEVTEFQPEVTELQPEVTELQPEVTEHQPEVTEHQPEVTELQPEVTELQPEVTELQPEVTELQHEVTELQPEVTELQPEVTELQPEVTEVQPEVTELQPEITELQREVTELQLEVTELKPEVTEHQPEVTEHQPEVTEHQPEVTEHQPEVTEHQPEVTEHQPEVTEHQPEVTELQPEVIKLQSEVTEFQPQVTKLQTKITKLPSEVTEFQTKVTEFHPEITEFQPKVTEFQSEITEFQPKVTEFQSEITEFQPKVTEFQSKVTEFQTKVPEFQSEVTEFQPTVTEFQSEVRNFQSKEVTEFQSEITEFETKVTEFQSEVTEFQPKELTVFQSEITEFQPKLREFQSEVTEFQPKVTEFQPKEVTEFHSEVSEFQSEVGEFQSKVTENQSKVAEFQSKVAELQSEVTEFHSEVTELEPEVQLEVAVIQDVEVQPKVTEVKHEVQPEVMEAEVLQHEVLQSELMDTEDSQPEVLRSEVLYPEVSKKCIEVEPEVREFHSQEINKTPMFETQFHPQETEIQQTRPILERELEVPELEPKVVEVIEPEPSTSFPITSDEIQPEAVAQMTQKIAELDLPIEDELDLQNSDICDSLSEPPPGMFDRSSFSLGDAYLNKAPLNPADIPLPPDDDLPPQIEPANSLPALAEVDSINNEAVPLSEVVASSSDVSTSENVVEGSSNIMDYESSDMPMNQEIPGSDLSNSELNSPQLDIEENSCEIPVQPPIITRLTENSMPSFDLGDESRKRDSEHTDEDNSDSKRTKLNCD